jgi:hypothetical protein
MEQWSGTVIFTCEFSGVGNKRFLVEIVRNGASQLTEDRRYELFITHNQKHFVGKGRYFYKDRMDLVAYGKERRSMFEKCAEFLLHFGVSETMVWSSLQVGYEFNR